MQSSLAPVGIPTSEFYTEIPAIFESMPWVRYGETRRTHPSRDILSGSVAQADLPLDNTFGLLKLSNDRDYFKLTERMRSANRISMLLGRLGLKDLARPRPEYSTRLLEDDQFELISSIKENRAFADAVHTKTKGRGIMFSPADCPLVVLADPTKNHQSLTVIHTGYKSLGEDIIGLTLDQLQLKTPNVHAFITPHALTDYPVYGPPLDALERSPVTQNHLGPTDDKGNRSLDFSGAIIARLGEFGVKCGHIQVSQGNSLTDPTLYSQRNWQQKGVNGRNAVMTGIAR